MAGLEILYFTAMGLLGGIAYCLVWGVSWQQLRTFKYSRRIFLGAIVGFLYNFLYSDYSFPNFVMSFVAGYMGTDFIIALAGKLRRKRK